MPRFDARSQVHLGLQLGASTGQVEELGLEVPGGDELEVLFEKNGEGKRERGKEGGGGG